MKLTIDGQEFELVAFDDYQHGYRILYALKPIPPHLSKQPVAKEPKWEVRLNTAVNIIEVQLHYTLEPQAIEIKEAVNELMEFITNRVTDDIRVENNYDLLNAIDKARDALRENK